MSCNYDGREAEAREGKLQLCECVPSFSTASSCWGHVRRSAGGQHGNGSYAAGVGLPGGKVLHLTTK